MRSGIAEIIRTLGAEAAAAMAPPSAMSEAILIALALVMSVRPKTLIGARRDGGLRLAAGDEGRQGVRVGSGIIAALHRRLRIGLLRAAVLLLIARRKRLRIARKKSSNPAP